MGYCLVFNTKISLNKKFHYNEKLSMYRERFANGSVLMLAGGEEYNAFPDALTEHIRTLIENLNIEGAVLLTGLYLGHRDKYVIYIENLFMYEVPAVRAAIEQAVNIIDPDFPGILEEDRGKTFIPISPKPLFHKRFSWGGEEEEERNN